MKRLAIPAALVLTVSAFAHNGMEHVMGTVAAVSATSLRVTGSDGTVTAVMADAKTMWMRGKVMITPADVHTGDRVVIHARKVDGKLLAVEVAVGAATHTH